MDKVKAIYIPGGNWGARQEIAVVDAPEDLEGAWSGLLQRKQRSGNIPEMEVKFFRDGLYIAERIKNMPRKKAEDLTGLETEEDLNHAWNALNCSHERDIEGSYTARRMSAIEKAIRAIGGVLGIQSLAGGGSKVRGGKGRNF